MSIINTNIPYSSDLLAQNIYDLLKLYPFINVQTIGNSILGKPIYVIKLGKGSKQVFYSASIHANEWITSLVLMKFVEDYCIAYTNNKDIYGYSIRNLFNTVSIYIAPMVNPDGVDLLTSAYNSNSNIFSSFQNIANNYPNIPFPDGWKANIRGVDLKNFQPVAIL